jgi:hypothetical protein
MHEEKSALLRRLNDGSSVWARRGSAPFTVYGVSQIAWRVASQKSLIPGRVNGIQFKSSPLHDYFHKRSLAFLTLGPRDVPSTHLLPVSRCRLTALPFQLIF